MGSLSPARFTLSMIVPAFNLVHPGTFGNLIRRPMGFGSIGSSLPAVLAGPSFLDGSIMIPSAFHDPAGVRPAFLDGVGRSFEMKSSRPSMRLAFSRPQRERT